MAEFVGDFSSPAGRFAIVAGRFNAMVTESLLAGCRDAFVRHGVAHERIDVAWVPGSFEIPAGRPEAGGVAAGMRPSSAWDA